MRGEKAQDIIVNATYDQVQVAIDAATVILLVVNVQEGIVALDREVAERLRRSAKPVLVAVNKVDNTRVEAGADEFSALGFERVFPVSAIHGAGIDALMQAALSLLPAEKAAGVPVGPEAEGIRASEPLKLAIVGRPNVG